MDFLKKIAGTDPLPAGGAAAAYTLGLAIGLINKVVLLEIYRQADRPEVEKNLLVSRKELAGLLQSVEKLTEQDAESYQRFDRSRRMGDHTRLEIDFDAAIDVSMKLLEKAAAALEWSRQLRPLTPRQMTPHLLVACELIMGAVNGTAHIARGNLNAIAAGGKRDDYLEKLNAARMSCHEKYHGIIEALAQEISSD